MQANAKILDKSTFFMVRTKHDRRRIEAISVSGHRVLVTLHEERFYGFVDGKEMEIAYPAGTGLMYNGEQKIHQIFPGGLDHMLRSRSHAANGEKKDSEAMRGMTQLTFDFISRLRTWTLIGEEGKDFTDQSLMRLASDLCEPKRNERKLKASRHYQKASELKTKNGKRTP
ncbi:hypothetical protein IT087_01075, partial [Candidatus Uhrbacteria bacterium]|nr:hypothetical protein [Candidatus Uhrbacteria bacterium]